MFGNFSPFKTPSLGWISVPTSFVSLFIFYILSYLFLKTMGCLSGCLMSSASIQKLFCRICSMFKCSFNELVREKVVCSSYSSAILGPPPPILFLRNFIDFSVHRCEITMSIICYVKITCKFFHIEKLVIVVT